MGRHEVSHNWLCAVLLDLQRSAPTEDERQGWQAALQRADREEAALRPDDVAAVRAAGLRWRDWRSELKRDRHVRRARRRLTAAGLGLSADAVRDADQYLGGRMSANDLAERNAARHCSN